MSSFSARTTTTILMASMHASRQYKQVKLSSPSSYSFEDGLEKEIFLDYVGVLCPFAVTIAGVTCSTELEFDFHHVVAVSG